MNLTLGWVRGISCPAVQLRSYWAPWSRPGSAPHWDSTCRPYFSPWAPEWLAFQKIKTKKARAHKRVEPKDPQTKVVLECDTSQLLPSDFHHRHFFLWAAQQMRWLLRRFGVPKAPRVARNAVQTAKSWILC